MMKREDVFDVRRRANRQYDIFGANEFVWKYLTYPYFEFNGKVWSVMHPEQFNMKDAMRDTDVSLLT